MLHESVSNHNHDVAQPAVSIPELVSKLKAESPKVYGDLRSLAKKRQHELKKISEHDSYFYSWCLSVMAGISGTAELMTEEGPWIYLFLFFALLTVASVPTAYAQSLVEKQQLKEIEAEAKQVLSGFSSSWTLNQHFFTKVLDHLPEGS